MSIRRQLVAAASREVGVREQGGNNRGDRIQVYQAATWLKPGDWPWCAAFCSWSLRAALIAAGVPPKTADSWRCQDASAFGWIAWAQRAIGCRALPPATSPIAGDLVVFDFNGPTAAGGGHIGIVELGGAVGAPFTTIEGNTGVAGARETTGGTDGVCRKSRGVRLVANFIRLPGEL